MIDYTQLKKNDPELYEYLQREINRQTKGLELIASENYVSDAVIEALGTVFTNKYSEGYPGKRYYGGQDNTDAIETITIERAKKLFGSDHANVQALSGAIANVAVMFSWLEPGDTILGLDLTHGGHLTHGSPVTKMAGIFNFVRYKMKNIETGEFDYDEILETAKRVKPKIILVGYSAYTRELEYAKFKEIADQVGAICWADIAHIAGLIAAKKMRNPFDYGFEIVSSTTHKTLRGPRGGLILSKGNIGNPFVAPEKKVENLPTLIDRAVFPGLQGGPLMNIVYAKGVAFGEALRPEFIDYAEQILKNAKALAEYLISNGVKLVTNGTDNHMMIMDVYKTYGIGGKEVEEVLDKVGLTTSKSTIPDDVRKPADPSGVRLGTPAATTRGLKEAEMEQIGKWIISAIENRNDTNKLENLRKEVEEMMLRFPVNGGRA